MHQSTNNNNNKKVLLRARKRHTARRVAALSPKRDVTSSSPDGGYPHPVRTRVLPIRTGWGYPLHPHPPSGRMGVPLLSGRMIVPPLHWEGWGYPLPPSADGGTLAPKVGQTHTCENIASRHSSVAGGNKFIIRHHHDCYPE